jgi:spore coat polysaccharide biosynthesis protein SpsF (cytidylyltransferase family)/RimJ/RimL family protein N-acetyltransferase
MAIGVIVQARMGSARLPGKVLKEVLGKPLLEFLIDRVKRAKMVDQVIIATTNSKKDNKIKEFALLNDLFIFRGSEDDVLDRYFRCATKFKLNTIVRITGDCPLIDPNIIDHVVKFYKNGHFDYVTNGINSTFPDGMDVEVFSFNVLKRAWREAKLSSEREYVTAYIWKNTAIFNIGIYKGKVNNSYLRLTVDEMEDFKLVKRLISDLYPRKHKFSLDDIILHLKKNPALVKINSKIGRNEGYFKSVSKDKILVGELKGKRIYLKELKLGNVTLEYCRWLNDKEVNKYLETKRSTINTLREYVSQKINDPNVIFLGIFDKLNNKHIGNIKLEGVGLKSKTAELGIMIGDKNYWGKGFANEAINILCDFTFKMLGLKSITLGVYSAHKSAIRSYEKAGFKFLSKKKGYDGILMKRNAS